MASPSASKKPHSIIPWTHQETTNLIQAYQEKWYELQRRSLKANQWEEIAVTVAVRCGYDHTQPSKTAVQCRHKMEKLRQRYRAEKDKKHSLLSASCSSSSVSRVWQYYNLMDQLEKGPLPISATPLLTIMPFDYDNDNVDDNEADYYGRGQYSQLRGSDYFLSEGYDNDNVDDNGEENVADYYDDYDKDNGIDERWQCSQLRGSDYFLSEGYDSKFRGVSEFCRENVGKRVFEEENEADYDDDNGIDGRWQYSGIRGSDYFFSEGYDGKFGGGGKRRWRVCEEEKEGENLEGNVEGMEMVYGVAAEMKAFAERIIGMENLKMEMMKETERCRLEMENKRIEMIVKSQQRIVDSIGKVFGFPKRMKISPEI